MSSFFDDDSSSVPVGIGGWPAQVRAALIFTVPFGIVDFFNYFSAGAAFVFSCPLLFLLYAGCGALASWFSSSHSGGGSAIGVGAMAGALLWLISTIVNTIISLILGTASLGATLILGIPYVLLCAPLSLFMGAIAGAVGALVMSAIFGRRQAAEY
jgi:hypothetical protein